jgi:hypothetical protein
MQETFKKIFEKNLKLLSAEISTDKLNQVFEDEKFAVCELGKVIFPTGHVVIADPLCYLGTEHACPLEKSIEPGEYPIILSVLKDEIWGIRYLAAKLLITDKRAVRYETAARKVEESEDSKKYNGLNGFGVETGLACFCDEETERLYKGFLQQWHHSHPGGNHYDDYFEQIFAFSYENAPKYQREGGDWIDWSVPSTTNNIIMFGSGFGDGYYQSYWGYDTEDKICCLAIKFIDPEAFDVPMPTLPPKKKYFPIYGGIKQLVNNDLACIATDCITVEGCKVGYMYKEEPMENTYDSGWRFFAGDESDEYLDDANNSGIYEVNTIANYDNDIIDLLDSPIDSAFYRGRDGKFHQDTGR